MKKLVDTLTAVMAMTCVFIVCGKYIADMSIIERANTLVLEDATYKVTLEAKNGSYNFEKQ